MYASRAAIVMRNERIRRRNFMINLISLMIFIGLNAALALWAWPKLYALQREKKRNARQNKFP